ncbi:CvpA family protein [Aminipila butyrica]|uniref:CvpA family protein n=1 Tax=Aminipila butyrica TaxID=433296 RepID=A0A858BRF2_9FIRM|nr:CvpA family protein [Aminipila butyrica]QIB68117.1 CvpA family protein [Aminipila butyrica]
MILDAIIAAVVIGSMLRGFHHGLLRSFVRLAGWLASLSAAFILSPKFNDFILEHTNCYDSIYENVNKKVSTTMSPAEMQGSMPTIIQEPLTNMVHTLSGSISAGLSNLFFTIACFLIVVLAVQVVLHTIISLFSREHNDGISGLLDGTAGMLFGFIKGIIYVFVLLALMIPTVSLFFPEALTLLTENLNASHLAGELYNNNLILLIMQDLFPDKTPDVVLAALPWGASHL